MDMSGEQRIPGTQQRVWDGLNDLDILKACIDGCESIERVSPTEHHLTLTAAVGPVKAKFKGKMHLENLDPPNSYRIRFEGQGGVAGFAKGEAAVSLSQDGADTILAYKVHAQVGGKLAQIGSRLVDAAAAKVADDFFNAFKRHLAPTQAGAPDLGPRRGGVPTWAWIAGAVAIAIVIYLVLR